MDLQELIALMAAAIYVRSPGHPEPGARAALMLLAVEEAKLLYKAVLASDRR